MLVVADELLRVSAERLFERPWVHHGARIPCAVAIAGSPGRPGTPHLAQQRCELNGKLAARSQWIISVQVSFVLAGEEILSKGVRVRQALQR